VGGVVGALYKIVYIIIYIHMNIGTFIVITIAIGGTLYYSSSRYYTHTIMDRGKKKKDAVNFITTRVFDGLIEPHE